VPLQAPRAVHLPANCTIELIAQGGCSIARTTAIADADDPVLSFT